MRRLACVAVACTLLAAAAAVAEPPPELVREAKRRFQRANQLYQDGRYADALLLYQAAYDLVASRDILFNIGLTKEKVLDYEGCALAFRDYLRDNKDAARNEQAEARLENCRARTLIPLHVSSLPSSASVTVQTGDTRSPHGRTPTRIDLRPGTYTILVEAPGYVAQSQLVTLEEGVHPDIDFSLEKLSSLRIEADVSGAAVFVDDHAEGESPVQHEIKAGLHRVRVEKPGYRTVTREVRVNAGDQLSLVMSLPPLPRQRQLALDVPRAAAGAVVRVDGADVGQAPLEHAIGAGTHRLEIERPGFLTFDTDVVVPDDRDLKLRAHLTPRRTRTQRAVFWTVESIASAVATAGVVFGSLALADQATFDRTPTVALGRDGHDKTIAADALFGASAVVGIAGAIYYLVTWPRAPRLETVR